MFVWFSSDTERMFGLLVLALGLVCWVSTTIITESELFRPVRLWLDDRWAMSEARCDYWSRVRVSSQPLEVEAAPLPYRVMRTFWFKARYLVCCPMCTGVWVAFALVVVTGIRVGRGFAGTVIATLLVKAIGHLVLELRPQAWAQ